MGRGARGEGVEGVEGGFEIPHISRLPAYSMI